MTDARVLEGWVKKGFLTSQVQKGTVAPPAETTAKARYRREVRPSPGDPSHLVSERGRWY